jgi:aminoglycoside phosphotransferase (APT) family kinase protein
MRAMNPSAVRRGLPRRRSGARPTLLASATAASGPALSAAASDGAPAEAGAWSARPGWWTATGVAIVPVGPQEGPPRALLRLSVTGAARLRSEGAVVAELRRTAAAQDLDRILPVRWSEGWHGGWWWCLDSWLEGVDAATALAVDPRLRAPVLRSGAAAAAMLHRATAVPIQVGDAELHDWVDQHVELLQSVRLPVPRAADRLAALQVRLRRGLAGREVRVGWAHGDLWRGNLRVDPATGAVTGLIDWDCAAPRQLPAHDLLHLVLYGLAVDRGVDLGTVIVEVLRTHRWPSEVEAAIAPQRAAWGDVEDEDLLLLYWLRHVGLIAAQQRDYMDHSRLVWRWRNIAQVLLAL